MSFNGKNMRFAKIGEEVFKRQAELFCEEFRLYTIIVFHTNRAALMCEKTLREIAEIYGLDYSNTMRRYKKLRRLGWCESTKKGIRPLVGVA